MKSQTPPVKAVPTAPEPPGVQGRFSNRFIVGAQEAALVLVFGGVIYFGRGLPGAARVVLWGVLAAIVVAALGGAWLAFRAGQPAAVTPEEADALRARARLGSSLTEEGMAAHLREERRRRADHASVPFARNWGMAVGGAVVVLVGFAVLFALYLGSGRAGGPVPIGQMTVAVVVSAAASAAFLFGLILTLTAPVLLFTFGFSRLGLLSGETAGVAGRASLVLGENGVESGILWEPEGGAARFERFPARITRLRLHPADVPDGVAQLELVSEGGIVPATRRHFLPVAPREAAAAEAVVKEFTARA